MGLSNIKLNPFATDKDKFRLRLEFRGPDRPTVIEADLVSVELTALLYALQQFQAAHKIPIHPTLRPKGKPKLSVVKPGDK
jgi:hypothetical protein